MNVVLVAWALVAGDEAAVEREQLRASARGFGEVAHEGEKQYGSNHGIREKGHQKVALEPRETWANGREEKTTTSRDLVGRG